VSALPIAIDGSAPELEQKALTFGDRARALLVVDQQSYEIASELLLGIKDLRKQAEEHHRPMIDAAHKSWKATLDGLKKVDSPLAEAEGVIKPKIAGYLAEQERIRLEAERQAREEAERIAAEALESSIEAAEAEGATAEEVQAIIQQPTVAPAVRVAPTVQRVSGVSMAKSYRAEVFDIRKLAKAVADGVVAATLIEGNQTALNQMARATKGSITIPGVRIIEEAGIRAGRR
jgi:hypothetical protein